MTTTRGCRPEVPTWSSPTVDAPSGQIIVNGYKHIGGYDLDTGEEIWKAGGGGDIPVPTPIVAHDLIFITNAHGRMAPILAISTAASGDFSMDADDSEHMVWSKKIRGNYMQTPLVYGNQLYCCNGGGVLRSYDALTGKKLYQKRLARNAFTTSGVAADGKLYFTSEDGEVHVVKAGPSFEVLAVNELGEICLATPAVSAGTLFFRTRSHLVAVAKDN